MYLIRSSVGALLCVFCVHASNRWRGLRCKATEEEDGRATQQRLQPRSEKANTGSACTKTRHGLGKWNNPIPAICEIGACGVDSSNEACLIQGRCRACAQQQFIVVSWCSVGEYTQRDGRKMIIHIVVCLYKSIESTNTFNLALWLILLVA
jgi:hypothetical protein